MLRWALASVLAVACRPATAAAQEAPQDGGPSLIPADAGRKNSEIWTKPPLEPEPPPEAQQDANQDPPPF